MSLKHSLWIFLAVALPIAVLRFGLEWANSIPAEKSSIPIVSPSYLVLREVVRDWAGRPDGLSDEDFTLELGRDRFMPVGEPVIDLSHTDAGSARLEVSPYSPDVTVLRIELTKEGTLRLSAAEKMRPRSPRCAT